MNRSPRALATARRSHARRAVLFSDDTPGTLSTFQRERYLAESFAGVAPWYEIRRAVNGANHDYIYNHTDGPEWVKGANADLGVYNAGPNELLDWEGGINLWQALDYQLQHGGTIDKVTDPVGADKTINAVIAATGILPEHVYNFVSNFARFALETGNANLVRAGIPETPIVSDLSKWVRLGAVIAIFGASAYVVHELAPVFRRKPQRAKR